MVRIRLRREGKRKQPFYRVVIADARSPRDGRFIEIIGQYDPMRNPSAITLDNDKALTWLRKGAQPSEQVKALLKRTGVWSEFVKDKGPALRPPKRKKSAAPPLKAESEAPKPEPEAKPDASDEAAGSEEQKAATDAGDATPASESEQAEP